MKLRESNDLCKMIAQTSAITTRYSDYRWIIGVRMLAGSVMNYLDSVNLCIAYTTIARDSGMDPIHIGLLLSAFIWPYAIANLQVYDFSELVRDHHYYL
ncbi:MAG: hypothetical protein AB2L14_08450 [Candidatus Xenobiia bacterium LiM19]